MTSKLLTEQETGRVERLVLRAARARFGRLEIRAFFEHGQWWVRLPEADEDGDDLTYSVVDAEPSVAGTGLDFEEV